MTNLLRKTSSPLSGLYYRKQISKILILEFFSSLIFINFKTGTWKPSKRFSKIRWVPFRSQNLHMIRALFWGFFSQNPLRNCSYLLPLSYANKLFICLAIFPKKLQNLPLKLIVSSRHCLRETVSMLFLPSVVHRFQDPQRLCRRDFHGPNRQKPKTRINK